MIAINLGFDQIQRIILTGKSISLLNYYAIYFNSAKVCGEGKSEELAAWEAYPKNNST